MIGRDPARSAVMKRPNSRVSVLVAFALLLGSCASTPEGPSQKLLLYRAHAGPEVDSFRYLGRMDSWESLGDDTIAVWTRPREAWLLELIGICNNLQYTTVIGLTSHTGQVRARFDKVLVRDPAGGNSPCDIQSIRPLDVDAIRQAEKQQREAAASENPSDH
jgi:hypothetical protein